ncbi:MAG: metallophosphoesterase, partial [Runella slithyformis]
MLTRRHFLFTSFGAIAAACQRPAQKNDKILRFAVASDGHYGQPKTEYVAYFDDIIKNLQRERQERGLDFVVFNGDLFHDNVQFLPVVKQQFERLGFPYYVTRGNHDHVTPTQWRETWGYELNHVVKMGQNALVLGDTSNEKGAYVCPDLAWIEKQLIDLKDKKQVFLFLHVCAKDWSLHGTECRDFEQMLLKYPNVKATFHGHDHAIDAVKTGKNKPAIFDGHF